MERSARLTQRDREVLAFIGVHRFVLSEHVRVLLGVSLHAAENRLRALRRLELIRPHVHFGRECPAYQITRRGLHAVDSTLPVPRRDLREYEHDVGVAWTFLAARGGAFGPVREIVPERTLRSRDRPGRRTEPPLAVPLGGVGPRGAERLHYPDLVLVSADGRRVAVELELTTKSRTRREDILLAYAADPNLDAVLYLAGRRSVGESVRASVRQLGLTSVVQVHDARLEVVDRAPGAGRGAERGAGRTEAVSR